MTREDRALLADIASLKADLRSLGYLKKPPGIACRWLGLMALAIGSTLAFAWVDGLAARACLFAASAFASIAAATMAHTASHGAASDNPVVNRVIFYATYPFFVQLSARWWVFKHIETHHPAPNVVGVDDDCDLRPVFALNEAHRRDLPRWQLRYADYHHWLLLLLLPVNGFSIQLQGWIYLLQELGDRRRRSASTFADLTCMMGHIAAWLVLPMAFWPVRSVVAFYVARISVMGVALFAVLAPGHYPAEAAVLAESERTAGSFFLRQTACTVNFRTGWVGAVLCSGLEYQIEHHLFPTLAHVHYAAISLRVRALCERHGLPHRTLGWWEAIVKSVNVFRAPKSVVSDATTLFVIPPAPLVEEA